MLDNVSFVLSICVSQAPIPHPYSPGPTSPVDTKMRGGRNPLPNFPGMKLRFVESGCLSQEPGRLYAPGPGASLVFSDGHLDLGIVYLGAIVSCGLTILGL